MKLVRVFTRDAVSIFLLNHTYEWSGIHNDRCKKGKGWTYNTGLFERAGAGRTVTRWTNCSSLTEGYLNIGNGYKASKPFPHRKRSRWPDSELFCAYSTVSITLTQRRPSVHANFHIWWCMSFQKFRTWVWSYCFIFSFDALVYLFYFILLRQGFSV